MDVRVYKLAGISWKFPLLCELCRQLTTLLRGRDLASQKEPEHALSCHFFATRSRRQHFLAVWDSQSMETNALDHALAMGSTVGREFDRKPHSDLGLRLPRAWL